MKRRFSLFWAILILQIICLGDPEIWAEEGDLAKTKNNQEIQRILKLRIEIKTEKEERILKEMGLKCGWGENKAICDVTVNQMDQLKQAGIEFEIEGEGIRIEMNSLGYEGEKENKGVVWGENSNNYWIPYQDWTLSPITINSAPAGAIVAWIDVHFEVIHPYVGDLAIDLTDEDLGHEYRLWDYQGGSQDNIDTTIEYITFFYGESVNQTWKLWGWDCCAGDTGYIDYWWLQIWYEELPDLIVQSLTASDYNPSKNFQKNR
jgi:subtilisin-like proprotein convertase family protein